VAVRHGYESSPSASVARLPSSSTTMIRAGSTIALTITVTRRVSFACASLRGTGSVNARPFPPSLSTSMRARARRARIALSDGEPQPGPLAVPGFVLKKASDVPLHFGVIPVSRARSRQDTSRPSAPPCTLTQTAAVFGMAFQGVDHHVSDQVRSSPGIVRALLSPSTSL